MITQHFIQVRNFALNKCETFVGNKYWSLWLALLLPLIIYFFAFPSFERINSEFAESWEAIHKQVQNPFVNHDYPPGSHQAKQTFRLTVPIIAHILHLNTVGILIFQFLTGVLFLYIVAKLSERITRDPVSALLLTLSVAFIYAGRVSFTEIRGIFDGIALFFLVLSLYAKSPILVASAVFLASWTDERALIASSLVFLYWYFIGKKNRNEYINTQCISIVIAWLVYFLCRYLLVHYFQFVTHPVGIEYLVSQINNLPISIWSALEGNWLLVVIAFTGLIKARKYTFATGYFIGIMIVLTIAMSVFDITRSMAYMLPALFISGLIITRISNIRESRQIYLLAAVISFLYPAYSSAGDYYIHWCYPLPIHMVRYLFYAIL